jgi:hypothetical protein
MNQFTRKGYGRIYVNNIEDIEIVKNEIKEMDAFEFEYLPEKLITTFDQYPQLEYTSKFDTIDLDKLTANLWKNGVFIFCLDNGDNEYISE